MTPLTLRAGLRRLLLSLAAAVAVAPALAAPADPGVHAEVEALLSRLASSGCRFNRNGDWHEAGEARRHLQRKLAYLEDKGTLKSTEQFIELAATQSSASGKAYQVQCPGEAAVPSARWLNLRLLELRRTPGQAPR